MHWRRIKGWLGGALVFHPTRHGRLAVTLQPGTCLVDWHRVILDLPNVRRLRDAAGEFLRYERAKAAEARRKARRRRERRATHTAAV
jgi:hypothetical protein